MTKETKHTEGYEITEDGKVFSILHNWRGCGRRELTQTLDAYDYPSVRVTVEGRRKHYPVHRLVAIHHLPPRPSMKHEIRHLDGDKLNNHVSNLAWGTRKENAADREKHGRTSRGASHAMAIKKGIQKSTKTHYKHNRAEGGDND